MPRSLDWRYSLCLRECAKRIREHCRQRRSAPAASEWMTARSPGRQLTKRSGYRRSVRGGGRCVCGGRGMEVAILFFGSKEKEAALGKEREQAQARLASYSWSQSRLTKLYGALFRRGRTRNSTTTRAPTSAREGARKEIQVKKIKSFPTLLGQMRCHAAITLTLVSAVSVLYPSAPPFGHECAGCPACTREQHQFQDLQRGRVFEGGVSKRN